MIAIEFLLLVFAAKSTSQNNHFLEQSKLANDDRDRKLVSTYLIFRFYYAVNDA